MTSLRVNGNLVSQVGFLRPFENLSETLAQISRGEDWSLFVSGDGGSVVSGNDIFNALNGRCKQATVLHAHSASVLPVMAAEKISIVRGGTMMLHPLKLAAYGTRAELLAEADRLDASTEHAARIIATRSGTKRQRVMEWLTGPDKYFTAEECVTFGLADEIIEPTPTAVTQSPFLETLAGEDDGRGALLLELLEAIGKIHCSNPEQLHREIYAWQALNIQQA